MRSTTLESPTNQQTRLLCEALWAWQLCCDCKNDSRCKLKSCPGQRLARTTPFFRYYRNLVSEYNPEIRRESAVIQRHEDVIAIIKLIQSQPNAIRSSIRQQILEKHQPRLGSVEDADLAINVAVRITFMINCSAESVTPGLLEHGPDQIRWRDDVSFCEFIEEAFPMTDDPLFGCKAERSSLILTNQLTARGLKKRINANFVPTSDIRSHLRYDRRTNTVEIYHHTTVLKEQLRLTKDEETADSTQGSLQLGALPRAIALEVIDSIQQVMFPLTDPGSFSMLRRLVSKHSMDPDCLRYESTAIRRGDEAELSYPYFGSRLAELHEEMQNPQPRGYFEQWLERRSGARYVMLATLVGVLIAILLGIASLIVSIIQAYIGYQAWKHPVSTV